MHGIAYDETRDEFTVTQQFAQAILTFRGGANGEEAPIRIIQGPKTGLRQFDKLSVDPVNDEVFAAFGNQVVFFDRKANGDVAPKRILNPRYLRAQQARVDPIHNLLVVAVESHRSSASSGCSCRLGQHISMSVVVPPTNAARLPES